MSSGEDNRSNTVQPNGKRKALDQLDPDKSPTSDQRPKFAKGNMSPAGNDDSNTIALLVSRLESLENQVIWQGELIEKLLDKINNIEKENNNENQVIRLENNEFPTLNGVPSEVKPAGNGIKCSWNKKVHDFLKVNSKEEGSTLKLATGIIKRAPNKSSSIVAFGVTEPIEDTKEARWKEDHRMVSDIFETIGLDSKTIVKTFRFNKKAGSDKIPPIRVILKDDEVTKNALNTASKLKTTKYNNVWLMKDLNAQEIIEQKKLRAMRDEQNQIIKDKYNNELKCVITKKKPTSNNPKG